MTIKTTRGEVLQAITEYYELGDLSFIETVNNITYGYKVEMKRNLTKQTNGETIHDLIEALECAEGMLRTKNPLSSDVCMTIIVICDAIARAKGEV